MTPMKKPSLCRLVLLIPALCCLPASLSLSCGGGDDYVPPSLSDLHGRYPGRSLERLMRDAGEFRKPQGEDDSRQRISTIIRDMDRRPVNESLKAVDECLAFSREHHSAKLVFALLHDLRDLLSANAVPVDDMESYAIWRESRGENKRPDDYFFYGRSDPKMGAWKQGVEAEREELAGFIKDCEEGRKPKGLLPHYLYAMGALSFHEVKDVESEKWFMRVVKEFPDHPRAETALFMAGRSALSQTRRDYGSGDGDKDRQSHALSVLGDYRTRYPQGRFIGDVIGWEGAVHYDAGNYLEALKACAGQLRFPGHPELAGPAIIMCEKCLRELASGRGENLKQTMAAIVRDPALTTTLVYHVFTLPQPQAYWEERKDAEIEKLHKEMLSAVAEALPAAEPGFQSKAWQPRFLAILAQTLSQCGRQKEAMALLDRNVAEGAKVEEWLFARAVVLERSDKLKEALAAYEDFEKRFPLSVWLSDASQRKAGVLKDLGQADEAVLSVYLRHQAVVEAREASKDDEASYAGEESLISDPIFSETLAALLYGAPVEQLVRLTQSEKAAPIQGAALKEFLARRLIGQRRYKEAAAFLPPEQVKDMGLDQLSGKPDAATLVALARKWTAARGKWLCKVPRLRTKDEVEAEDLPETSVWERPRVRDPLNELVADMKELRLPVTEERQYYDELSHALDFYRRAARLASASKKAGAEARLEGLDAMCIIARCREDALETARNNGWSRESRQWWEELRLLKNAPIDASRAVYWSFDVPKKKTPQDAGRVIPYWVRYESGNAWSSDPDLLFNAVGAPPYGYEDDRRGGPSTDMLRKLVDLQKAAARGDADYLRKEGEPLRQQAEAARPSPNAVFVLNALNDICLAGTKPGVKDAAWCVYCGFRLSCLSNAAWGNWELARYGLEDNDDETLLKWLRNYQADSSLGSLADFFDALEVSLEANHGAVRDWEKVEGLCRAFLAKHVQSFKREAVRLHLVRSVYRAHRPGKGLLLKEWNALGFDASWQYLDPDTDKLPAWDPAPTLAAIAEYWEEFPENGRYAREVDKVAGVVAWRRHDYSEALTIAGRCMADPRSEAFGKVLLANLIADLENPKLRVLLMAKLKKHAEVHEGLKSYLDSFNTEDGQSAENQYAPLAFMRGFVREQILTDGPPKKRPFWDFLKRPGK